MLPDKLKDQALHKKQKLGAQFRSKAQQTVTMMHGGLAIGWMICHILQCLVFAFIIVLA